MSRVPRSLCTIEHWPPVIQAGVGNVIRSQEQQGPICLVVAALLGAMILPAHAACRQELSVYSETEANASLEFTPAASKGSTSHTFKIKFPENSVILDGVVMWTEGVARPVGIVMH